jgi:hypothetical protein
MTFSKPEGSKDQIWDQHLRWLDLVRDESRANQAKYERRKRRQQEGAPREPQR